MENNKRKECVKMDSKRAIFFFTEPLMWHEGYFLNKVWREINIPSQASCGHELIKAMSFSKSIL